MSTANHKAASILRAIAHPERLRLLEALRESEECVCHLTALLRQRQAYVSQQLMLLRQAGLIEDHREGTRIYYRIQDPRVFQVLDAVHALAGEETIKAKRQTAAACPCPKCQTSEKRQAG